MKKIGLICLALVLALGTLGVGYALWSDEVVIEGTVDTGTVRLGIIKAMLEELDQDKPVATVNFSFEGEIAPWECDLPLRAEDYAYEKLVIALNNTFPCLAVDIAFYVGTVSTIPVHITGINITDTSGELTWVWEVEPPSTPCYGYFYHTGDPDKERVIEVSIGGGVVCNQLEECEYVKGDLTIHVEQAAEQDHEYQFEVKVIGEQWAK